MSRFNRQDVAEHFAAERIAPTNEAGVPPKTTSDIKVRRAVGEYLLRHQGDVYIWLTAHAVFAKGTNAADIRKAHEQILDYARSMIVKEGLSNIEYVPASALAEVWKRAIAVVVGLPVEHYIYSGAHNMDARTFRDNAIKSLEAAMQVTAARDAALSVGKESDES